MTADLNTLLKDGNKDNKQKIAEQTDLFYDKIVALYTRSFFDLMALGQECVANEYLNDFH